jgi:outer membrane receptor protein involved in Fe transport
VPLNGGWMAHFGAPCAGGRPQERTTNISEIYLDTTTPPTLLVSTVTPPLEVDSYWSLDLNAYVANENWTVRAYAKNVTDERGYQSVGDITSALTGATAKLSRTDPAAYFRPRS